MINLKVLKTKEIEALLDYAWFKTGTKKAFKKAQAKRILFQFIQQAKLLYEPFK
ncbi:hypothetical protein M0R04_06595 [Candidatus Dojkabacteria bacterium]|jgi:hypothetical protein|nr:hypothetical protein [Candidatus Dojkabacteria bacterium]